MIYVYNRKVETHNGPNNFYIGRGSALGNPYTHITEKKTKAIYKAVDRDDAIEKYSHYFDLMYGSNIAFTNMVDVIYEMYKSGMDVYLECYCAPLRCHGDIIKEKLEARLLKEKIKELMRNESSVQKQ